MMNVDGFILKKGVKSIKMVKFPWSTNVRCPFHPPQWPSLKVCRLQSSVLRIRTSCPDASSRPGFSAWSSSWLQLSQAADKVSENQQSFMICFEKWKKNHSRCSSQIWINANSHKQKHLCLLLSLPQGKLILLEQRDRGFLMVLGVRLPVCTILGFSFGCQSWRPPLSNARLPQPNPQHSAAKLPGRNGDRPF